MRRTNTLAYYTIFEFQGKNFVYTNLLQVGIHREWKKVLLKCLRMTNALAYYIMTYTDTIKKFLMSLNKT